MRFLANKNFPLDAVEALRIAGHDVVWIRTESPGATDVIVLSRAQQESRTLLTFDKDFGELAFRTGLPASCDVILFRIPTPSSMEVATKVVSVIEMRTDWAGAFSVVEQHRIRTRTLPPASSNT